jgi:transposase
MWLRASLNLSVTETALAVGWSQITVKIVQSRYLREGEKVLIGKGRGGKRYSNLTEKEEADLLSSFLEKARVGGVLVVSEIKAAYEKKLGKQVPKSTVYRMLARHGWRKIMPRPKHPKAEKEVQEEFKKNFLSLSKKK